MHNWSDEEMDRFSREAAERYSPPSADGGWEALSKRLDVEMPVKDRKRRAFFWLFFAGLLLGGTVYWSNTRHPETATKPEALAFTSGSSTPGKTTATVEQMAPVNEQASIPAVTPALPEKQSLAAEKNIPAPLADNQNEKVSSNTSLRNGPANRVVHGSAVGVPQGAGTGRKSKAKQYQGKVPPAEAGNGNEPPVPARSAKETSGQLTVDSEQKPVNSGQIQQTSNPQPTTNNEQPTTNNQQPTTKNQQPTTKNQQPTTNSRKSGRWEFSLQIAPDLSAVEFYGLGKTGIMGGGTVGYHLSERWTLSTGLYYTVKHYDSPGEAYHLPGYWANNPAIKMQQVNAVCNMWDIPLNIRYDIHAGKTMRFFASTGLSSYLMRKEDLHYYYTYNNNPYDRSYVYKKKSDYWFAIANISAGFERSLGKGFSLQAEPFAKFSLAEVGTGKIKLNSYGLFVGLKYRPFKVVHPHH